MALNKRTITGLITAATLGAVALWGGSDTPPPSAPACVLPPGMTCELPCADRETWTARECLACHDGSAATMVGAHYNYGEALGNHPYDVSLYMAPLSAAIRPTIPSQLVLSSGSLVTCTTCHNYWAIPQQPHWVAVPYSELCQGCHDK